MWLDKIPCTYRFKCSSCNNIEFIEYDGDIPEEDIKKDIHKCSKCENNLEFCCFEFRKLGIMTKVTFEQNGRVGIEIQTGGHKIRRSMTKENYLNGKGSESVLTKGCQEATEKEKQKILRRRSEIFKRQLERVL